MDCPHVTAPQALKEKIVLIVSVLWLITCSETHAWKNVLCHTCENYYFFFEIVNYFQIEMK